MLSKTEQEFLRDPASFNSNYQRSLHCRLKVKAEKMRGELPLLKSYRLNVVENCNGVAEFCRVNQCSNQDHSVNQGEVWSLRRDLDPKSFNKIEVIE